MDEDDDGKVILGGGADYSPPLPVSQSPRLLSLKALACTMVQWFRDDRLQVPVHCLVQPLAATGAEIYRLLPLHRALEGADLLRTKIKRPA